MPKNAKFIIRDKNEVFNKPEDQELNISDISKKMHAGKALTEGEQAYLDSMSDITKQEAFETLGFDIFDIFKKIHTGEKLTDGETEYLESVPEETKRAALEQLGFGEDEGLVTKELNADSREYPDLINVDKTPITEEDLKNAQGILDFLKMRKVKYDPESASIAEGLNLNEHEKRAIRQLLDIENNKNPEKPKTPEYNEQQLVGITEANKANDETTAKREEFWQRVKKARETVKTYKGSKDHGGISKKEAQEAVDFLNSFNAKPVTAKPVDMSYADDIKKAVGNTEVVQADTIRNKLGAHTDSGELIEDESELEEVSPFQKVFDYLSEQKDQGVPFNEAWRSFVDNNDDLVNQMMDTVGDDKIYSKLVKTFKDEYGKMENSLFTRDKAAIQLLKRLEAAKKARITTAKKQAQKIEDIAKEGVKVPGAKEYLNAKDQAELAEAQANMDQYNKDVRNINYGYANLGNLPKDTKTQREETDAVLRNAAKYVTAANAARSSKYTTEDWLNAFEKHPNVSFTINGNTNAHRGSERLNLVMHDPDNKSVPEKVFTLTGKDVRSFLNAIQEADRDIPIDIRIVNRDIKARDQSEDDNSNKYVNRYKNMLKFANPDFVFGDPTIEEFSVLPYGLDTSGLTTDQINFLKTKVNRNEFGGNSSFRMEMPDYYEKLADVVNRSNERGLKAYLEGKDLKYPRIGGLTPKYKDWGAPVKQFREKKIIGDESDVSKPMFVNNALSERTAKFNNMTETEDLLTPVSARSAEENDLYDVIDESSDPNKTLGKMSWGIEDPTTGLPVLRKLDTDDETGISTYLNPQTGNTYEIDTDAGDVPSQLTSLAQDIFKNQDADLAAYEIMRDLPESAQKLARMRLQNAASLLDALEDPEALTAEDRPVIDRKFVNTPSALRYISNRVADLIESNPEMSNFRDMIEGGNLYKTTRKNNIVPIFGALSHIITDKDPVKTKKNLRDIIKAYMLMDNYDLTRPKFNWEDMRTMLDGEINNIKKFGANDVPEGIDIEDLLKSFENARKIATKGSEIFGGAMDKKSLQKRVDVLNKQLALKQAALKDKDPDTLTDEELDVLDQEPITTRDYRMKLEQDKLDFLNDLYNANYDEVDRRYNQVYGDDLDKMSWRDKAIMESEKADKVKQLSKRSGPTMEAALRNIFEPLAFAGVPKAVDIVEKLNDAAPSAAQLAKGGFNVLTSLLGMTPDQANILLNVRANPDKAPNNRVTRNKKKSFYAPGSEASRILDEAQDMLVKAEHTDTVKKLVKELKRITNNAAKKGNKDAIDVLKQQKENKNLSDEIYSALTHLTKR